MTNMSKKNIKKSNRLGVNNKDTFKKNHFNDKKIITKEYKFNKCITTVVIVILSCVFVYSVFRLGKNQLDMYRHRRDSRKLVDEVVIPNGKGLDNLEEIETTESEEIEITEERIVRNPEDVMIDFNKLKSINSDIVAWMMFNNMYINNPVVQTSDNNYYLTINFYNKTSELGTLFMDYRNSSFDDRNVVIFGHSTIDKSMFGSLSDVFKKGYFDILNADIIYFYDTNNNLLKYQIFSYYTIENEEYYIKTNFSSDESFQEWVDTIRYRSIGNRNIEVGVNDKILTLSTCAGSRGTKTRRVIHAKRI